MTDLLANELKIINLERDTRRSETNPDIQVFKWYNWEHGNFALETKALEGRANFYLNFVGETSFQENAITGIPINKNDSIWYAELDSGDTELKEAYVTIYRSDYDRSP